jgi:ATP-dependent DNA helicase RecQ
VVDATVMAQKLLSAAYRTGQSYGLAHLEKVLTGVADERITQRGHDQLSVFGIVNQDDVRLLRPLARALQARGSLLPTEHGGLALGPDAKAILRGELPVLIALPPTTARQSTGRSGKRASGALNPVGDPLFEALRTLRRDLAVEAGVPPYVIFHDATLREIAQTRPTNASQFGAVMGVGARKLEAWGEAFMAVVRQF